MKLATSLCVFITSWVLLLNGFSEDKSAANTSSQPAATKTFAIRYQPPKTGAPDLRVGSGTRSGSKTDMILTVIAPAHAGYTVNPSPRLFWYQSKTAAKGVELYITDIKAMKTVYEKKLTGPSSEGFHSVDLKEQNFVLKPGTLYEWSVTVTKSGADRSLDTVTTGAVVYTPPPRDVEAILRENIAEKKATLLAEKGFWYDAFATVSDLVQEQPKSARFVGMRNDLLAQTGLKQATE